MTQPAASTDEQLSGRAADAVADMHDELARRFTGLNTAEAELAEALLTAQATTEAGRQRLGDIQRQVIEAINNPVNALDTPAGERQFLIFLRGKVAEIQSVLDEGALTAQDQAELMHALANGYLADAPRPAGPPGDQVSTSAGAAQPSGAAPGAGMTSLPQALGGLPQAGAAPGGLGAAASPLAGLASLLAGPERSPEAADDDGGGNVTAEEDRDDDDDEQEPADDGDPPAVPDDPPPVDSGPAETRPAAS
jgi:hypothetical protein